MSRNLLIALQGNLSSTIRLYRFIWFADFPYLYLGLGLGVEFCSSSSQHSVKGTLWCTNVCRNYIRLTYILVFVLQIWRSFFWINFFKIKVTVVWRTQIPVLKHWNVWRIGVRAIQVVDPWHFPLQAIIKCFRFVYSGAGMSLADVSIRG